MFFRSLEQRNICKIRCSPCKNQEFLPRKQELCVHHSRMLEMIIMRQEAGQFKCVQEPWTGEGETEQALGSHMFSNHYRMKNRLTWIVADFLAVSIPTMGRFNAAIIFTVHRGRESFTYSAFRAVIVIKSPLDRPGLLLWRCLCFTTEETEFSSSFRGNALKLTNRWNFWLSMHNEKKDSKIWIFLLNYHLTILVLICLSLV